MSEGVSGDLVVRYRGQDRRGLNTVGTTTLVCPLAEWVEEKHRQGWRWLDVTLPDGEEIVGQIMRHPEKAGRTWWADSAATSGSSTKEQA